MTVICVESNPIILCNLRKRVSGILPEADVLAFRTSRQAKKAAQEKGCHILITEIDFGFGKSEGIILAREIQELNPQVNIIFATAGSVREYAAQMLKMKISGFLIKPFSKEELKEELENLRYSRGEIKCIS